MADDNFDEDIFDDLYDDEPAKPAPAAPVQAAPEPVKAEPAESAPSTVNNAAEAAQPVHQEIQQEVKEEPTGDGGFSGGSGWNGNGGGGGRGGGDDYGPINVKEDGKMFIGGLNWETTEDSLKDYFSQFGEVSECTVMRDAATGRSRGFGFLTFRDPKCVNTVMVKEHYLDGKIIDPKRAIPREEQERTSKIFVGGVSQEATEEDFKNFFKQFGRVVDATLMMDKDTGRPRGFGFVTFDGDAAVDACLSGPLQILGKPIEVKRAQPRGNMREEEENKKFGRGGNKFGSRDNGFKQDNGGYDNGQNANQGGANSSMTPAMMAQYWQRMQEYFRQMQQNIAGQGPAMANPMMGGMNPAMMGMMQGMGGGGNPQMGGMNPAMMGSGAGNFDPSGGFAQGQQFNNAQQGGNFGPNAGGNQGAGEPRPAYNAHEQMAFEQQKYQQQEQRRMQQSAGYGGQGGPTSWEGMYDEIPPPQQIPSGPGGGHRGGFGGKNNRARQGSSAPPNAPNAPANAPTGPKNAGKPYSNYRGGGRGGGGGFRHNPYGGRG